MLNDGDKKHKGRIENIFSSMMNISPSQLGGTDLFDFESLAIDRSGGDKLEYNFSDSTVSSFSNGG